jgi:hypothetical protein
MKNSLRLSALLVGLVGINVYVFFFNHKTAPREVLNLQSTTKTMETNRRQVLSADVRSGREAIATSTPQKRAAEPRAAAPAPAPVAQPEGRLVDKEAAPAEPEAEPPPAPPRPLGPAAELADRTLAANIPPPHAPYQIPFAPPPEPPAPRGTTPHAPRSKCGATRSTSPESKRSRVSGRRT